MLNTRFWSNNYHIKYRCSINSGVNFFNGISNMKALWVSGLLRKMYQREQKIEAISNNYNSPTLQSSSSIMPLLTLIQSQISSGFTETIKAVSALGE